ncbi:MAG: DmsC/YnfH family molybdoenzyme membrane anchor subunit [Acidimicrobiales bacterium]
MTIAGPALLPLEAGEQYRFTFDMEACVGCHSCEVACAEQNDTPVDQAWRRVGELEGGTFPDTRRFSLSIACNHCVEPTCLSGCPTNAYEKLGNGLVVHHEDDCIGCQYCIWNCPYEVPVFNPVRKIVSKCDMCRPRIDAGQNPACVQSCPSHAIGIEPVNVAAWREDSTGADAPGLPPASITLSTTRIVLPHALPEDTSGANERAVTPEHPHWPLIVLTLLTQLSLGMVAATVLLGLAGAGRASLEGAATAAWLAGALALGASLFHLGRPTRALKALRNLRTSWLSREVALFGIFSFLCLAYAAGRGSAVGVAVVVAGMAGVYASARLYLVPARPVWNSRRTPVAFFATAASVGPVAALLCVDRSVMRPGWIAALLAIAAAGSVAQLAVMGHLMVAIRHRRDAQHQGTADLLAGPFRGLVYARVTAAGITLALLAYAADAPLGSAASGGRLAVAFVVAGLGELIGRYLFYVTVVPYRVAAGFFGLR